MSHDAGFRVIPRQLLQQFEHGMFLQFGASIGRMALIIETALVTDTKGTVVEMAGMCALNVLWEDRDDVTATTNIIVVRGLSEAGFAGGDEPFNRKRTVAFCGGTVNDNQSYRIVIQWFHT